MPVARLPYTVPSCLLGVGKIAPLNRAPETVARGHASNVYRARQPFSPRITLELLNGKLPQDLPDPLPGYRRVEDAV
ncbi:hypothetical protein AIOL_004478 [Candidatus Rhodobacter oscarellae]|uniref:Uncharacterized protein n=1 Tax=Candidatus Rhodobacter oscarellae TaxID=1675527 RepID=A0A0J9EA25_9RHOB|nr:hypothetical protein [Candidatus Rhodobacter lobularis]KMW59496.1 hypothetical protein AIOL_004478 [Candidatus Rhodobacter lobularis]